MIGSIIIGLIAGLLARAIHPGDDKMSWLWTVALGIGGSMFAGLLGRLVGWYKEGQSAGLVMSVVGAVALLAIYNRIEAKRLQNR